LCGHAHLCVWSGCIVLTQHFGAEEACWAHNPKVVGSRPTSANLLPKPHHFLCPKLDLLRTKHGTHHNTRPITQYNTTHHSYTGLYRSALSRLQNPCQCTRNREITPISTATGHWSLDTDPSTRFLRYESPGNGHSTPFDPVVPNGHGTHHVDTRRHSVSWIDWFLPGSGTT